MDPASALKRAVELHGAGQIAAAEAAYRELLGAVPDHTDALQLLGALLAQRGDAAAAVELMQRSLSLNETQAGVHANMANALIGLQQYPRALQHFARAQALAPELPAAWINHGGALVCLGRLEEAVVSCSRAMTLAPDHPVPMLSRAHALRGLGRFEAALADCDRVLGLLPENVEVHLLRAAMLLNANRAADAVASLDLVIRKNPTFAPAHFNRAIACLRLGLIDEAVSALRGLERIDSCYEGAWGWRLYAQLMQADWSDWERDSAAIGEAVGAGRFAVPPLAFLALCDSPGLQLKCAEIFVRSTVPASVRRGDKGRYAHARPRIAYLSSDLTEHALAYLMAGVFERHDRERFEIMAFSLCRDEQSAMGRRVRAAFERVIEIEGLAAGDIAAMVRANEIDILVDLMGFTAGSRAEVLAHRPAPVQVSYLGFPATLGRSTADYVIADDFLIPPERRSLYGESVVYLPDCFQANDERRTASSAATVRAQWGLPEAAFVWCSFNASYKINPPLFDVWIRLVRAVAGSVLWIHCPNVATERNLRQEAARRGLDPQRIVAAPTVPYPRHLERLVLADLCLDTSPFSGGTTSSDALWAGVPIVTYAGHSFAARMTGSLLRCVGLPELITGSLDDYERTARDLALDPRRLRELRDRLARSRSSGPLFDSARMCRHLEAAYTEMYERHRRGDPPAAFRVLP